PARLAVQRNYLLEKLTALMMRSPTNQSTNITIRNLLSQAEVLFQRGLHNQASKILTRADQLARKTNQFALQLDLLELYESYLVSYSHLHKAQQSEKRRKHLLSIIDNLHDCKQFSYQILLQSSIMDYARSAKQRAEIRNYYSSALISRKDSALSVPAQFHLLYARYMYAIVAQDPKAMKSVAADSWQLFDSEKEATGLEINYCLTSIWNTAVYFFQFGDLELYKKAILRWEAAPREFSNYIVGHFSDKYQCYEAEMNLRIALFEGNTDKLIREIGSVKKLLAVEHPYQAIFEKNTRFYVAAGYYAEKRYKDALHELIDEVGSESVSRRRYRSLLRGMLLRLMIHCDQEHDDVAELLDQRLSVFIARHDGHTFSEGLIIGFFTKWITANKKERNLLCRNLAEAVVKKYSAQHDWQFFTNNQFFIAWLMTQYKNISWSEALKMSGDEFRKQMQRLFS
ncbi:MAG: hypothetical protein ACRC3B_17785, partial [Bacteroidia bacterium]